MATTLDRVAPSAMRMPISPVRRATRHDLTPSRPTEAKISAWMPNRLVRRAIRRSYVEVAGHTGNERRKMPWMSVRTAVLVPISSPSVITAVRVNPGDLCNCRKA